VTQVRDNIFLVEYSELGEPFEKGYYQVADLGEVLIDQADVRYIEGMKAKGLSPRFFVSKEPALHGYVVIARQVTA